MGVMKIWGANKTWGKRGSILIFMIIKWGGVIIGYLPISVSGFHYPTE
jgi:hypothetical protein